MDAYGSLIAYMSGLVKAQGGINLAQGVPGFEPPAALLSELTTLIPQSFHQYPPGNGDPVLIESILSKYQQIRSVTPENLTILQGATEAISLVYLFLHLTHDRPLVSLAFDPVYESYLHLPRIYGDELVRMSFLSGGVIDWDHFERLVTKNKIGLVFVNSPGNPYGKIWSKSDCAKLMDLSEKHQFYILYDGVYQELYFSGAAPFNPLSMASERLFYVNSFSKLFSVTGWRIGYLIADEKYMKGIRDIHDYTGLCASSLMQRALGSFLKQSKVSDTYIQTVRSQLNQAVQSISGTLKQLGFQFDLPRAGYFLWAQLPEGYPDGIHFCLDLFKKKGVAMVPGIHFSPKGESFVRINYARKENEILAALESIESYLTA